MPEDLSSLTLDTLPKDVLLSIIDFLEPKDLARLSAANHQFYHLTNCKKQEIVLKLLAEFDNYIKNKAFNNGMLGFFCYIFLEDSKSKKIKNILKYCKIDLLLKFYLKKFPIKNPDETYILNFTQNQSELEKIVAQSKNLVVKYFEERSNFPEVQAKYRAQALLLKIAKVIGLSLLILASTAALIALLATTYGLALPGLAILAQMILSSGTLIPAISYIILTLTSFLAALKLIDIIQPNFFKSGIDQIRLWWNSKTNALDQTSSIETKSKRNNISSSVTTTAAAPITFFGSPKHSSSINIEHCLFDNKLLSVN